MKVDNKAAQLFTEEAQQHNTSPAKKGHPQLGGGAVYNSHGATSCCSLHLTLLTEPCPFAEHSSEDSDIVYLFDTPLNHISCTSGTLVDSQGECLKAAQAANGPDATLAGSGWWSSETKGCIQNSNNVFFYNSHPTGKSTGTSWIRPVCQRPKNTEDRVAALEQLLGGCPYDWKEEDDDPNCSGSWWALGACTIGHQNYFWAKRNCKFKCNPNCDVSLAHREYSAPV